MRELAHAAGATARLADRVEAETARFGTTMQGHQRYIGEHGDDMPEILDWRWPA